MASLRRTIVSSAQVVCWSKMGFSTPGGVRHAWYYEAAKLRMVCGDIGGGRQPKTLTRKTPGQRACQQCLKFIASEPMAMGPAFSVGVPA